MLQRWAAVGIVSGHPLRQVGGVTDIKAARGKATQNVRVKHHRKNMVGLGGLEPPTSRLSGVRSNHLSYRPPAENGGKQQNHDSRWLPRGSS
jgi:hypothetical protein